MGAALKVTGAAAAAGSPNIITFLPLVLPITAGLRGLYKFGGIEALSLVNLANPAAPLTKIGSPAINSVGVSISPGNGFDTGLLETDNFTVMAIAKVPAFNLATTGVMLAGSIGAIDANGKGFVMDIVTNGASNPSIQGTVPTNTTGSVVNRVLSAPGTLGQWNFYGHRAAASAFVSWGQAGALTHGTAGTVATRQKSGRTIKIGTTPSGEYPTPGEIALIAIFDSSLSTADFQANYAALMAHYALGGITTF